MGGMERDYTRDVETILLYDDSDVGIDHADDRPGRGYPKMIKPDGALILILFLIAFLCRHLFFRS